MILPPDLQQWVESYEAEERRLGKEQEMGRYASEGNGGGDFKQAPAGTHVARCYRIIDLGTQHGEYQGEPTVRQQIIVSWELPNETEMIDGAQKPLIVSRFYTNSLGEKANLRKDLEAWRSRSFTSEELRGFDLENILGKPCMVTVALNEKGKAKVTGVTALPKGTICPPQVNGNFTFWVDPWDDSAFHALPDGIKKLIEQSDEYKGLSGSDAVAPPVVESAVPKVPF